MATHNSNLSKFFKISALLLKFNTHARAFASVAPASAAWRFDALTRLLLHNGCSLKCLRELHALLAVAGAIQDTSVVASVVERYLSLDKPASAASVFAGAYRRQPVVYSLNLAVRCFSEHGFHRELLDLYRELSGFGSDNFTFPLVIKACTALSCLGLGKEVHCMVLRTGHGGNVGVQTALLDMYAKVGQIDVSRRVFDGMVQRDLISWNAMISGYALNGCLHEAVNLLQEMQQDGLRANASTLVGTVGMCSGVGAQGIGDSLHAFSLKCGVVADESLTSALISMYSAYGDLSSSRLVFDLQPVRDLVSCNSMISAYMQHNNWKEAFDIFTLMHCEGLKPNVVTVVSILPSCSDFFGINHGESVHGMAIKFGLTGQVSVVSALVSMYSKLRKLDSAALLFLHVTEKNNLLWNSMISGYLVNNEWNTALDMFRKMQEEDVAPDAVTIINVISGCRHTKDLHMAKSMHAYVVRNRFESNQSVMNALLAMYCDCGEVSTSYSLFEKMKIRTLISWNTIISGVAEVGDSETSLRLFCQMCQEGVQYDLVTLISLINSLSLSAGESIHCLAIKSGCISDVSLTNALITMYTKCGFLEADISVLNALIDTHAKCGSILFARKLFDSSIEKDSVTWGTMINAYSVHGDGDIALDLFSMMIDSGVEPDDVTFVSILSACSHSGFVEQGRVLFKSLQTEHGIAPRMEHYACIVDLLGRTGHLNEAYDIVRSMPFRPSDSLLESLLGACKFHGDAKIGESVGKLLIESEHGKSRSYVMLSNIYASTGKWSSYEQLRSDMEAKGLRKDVGVTYSA